MKIRKNDEVMVATGADRGKKGKVHRTYPPENRILVEGIHVTKRHMKPKGNTKQAGIVELESPINVSKVMLICTKCHQPTRVGFRILQDRSKVRICKKCSEVID
ncbi:50S ribosomal protein L24 [Chloroflexota bacterium]